MIIAHGWHDKEHMRRISSTPIHRIYLYKQYRNGSSVPTALTAGLASSIAYCVNVVQISHRGKGDSFNSGLFARRASGLKKARSLRMQSGLSTRRLPADKLRNTFLYGVPLGLRLGTSTSPRERRKLTIWALWSLSYPQAMFSCPKVSLGNAKR